MCKLLSLNRGENLNNAIFDDEQINYDIFNALNLHHCYLGEEYLKNGFNPFKENFKMDISFVRRYLDNKKYQTESLEPDFTKQTRGKVLKSFKNAKQNNEQIINEIDSKIKTKEFENIKKQLEEIFVFLKMRERMLDISIRQLSKKNIDSYKALINIEGINKKLSELLRDEFETEFKKQIIIQNLFMFAKEQKAKKEDLYENEVFDSLAQILKDKDKDKNQDKKLENNQSETKSINYALNQLNKNKIIRKENNIKKENNKNINDNKENKLEL